VDHENAKFLAEGLARLPGIKIDPAKVMTNILVCDISETGMTSGEFARRLAEKNVLCGSVNNELVRFVTHMDVDRAACERAVQAVHEVVRNR
ncbi:MAG: low specificity L-threonine aldolase, partial [Terriglobales bacterium]